MMPLALTLLCVLSVGALLFAERGGHGLLRGLAKTAGSLSVLGVALARPDTLTHLPGQLIVLGLGLSVIGDVFLLARREVMFLAGMGAFALAHLAYAAGFLVRGAPDLLATALAAAAMVVTGGVVLRWLKGRLGSMAPPIAVYIVLIGLMVATAMGAVAASTAPPLLGLGAVLFAVSDLAVARERFIADTFRNKLWGLPLYYAAQLLFAWGA